MLCYELNLLKCSNSQLKCWCEWSWILQHKRSQPLLLIPSNKAFIVKYLESFLDDEDIVFWLKACLVFVSEQCVVCGKIMFSDSWGSSNRQQDNCSQPANQSRLMFRLSQSQRRDELGQPIQHTPQYLHYNGIWTWTKHNLKNNWRSN